MSDIRDDIRLAQAKVRAASARCLARRDAAREQVSQLEGQLASVRAEAQAVRDSGDAGLADKFDEVARDLEARLTAKREELVLADQGHGDAQAELAALRRAEGEALCIPIRQATTSDPLMPTPEENALANVRAHLADLQARLSLDEELHAEATPPAATPALPMSEQQARDELAALKDKLGKGSGDGSGGGSKRTM